MLFSSIKNDLEELTRLLEQLSVEQYSTPSNKLSGSSIGAHYRHIIEFFMCLLNGYEPSNVNYDTRKRDQDIQSNPSVALKKLNYIIENVHRENKKIILTQCLHGEELVIESNYYRELLYNLEHSTHHQALIKIAVRNFSEVTVHEDFGVAVSTIAYREQCVE